MLHGVAVARDEPQRHLLAAATDEQRHVLAAEAAGRCARYPPRSAARPRTAASPWSMPRITGSASRSQRSRSPGDSPKSMPNARASVSFHADADAQVRPAAADVVERRGHLGRRAPGCGKGWRRPSAQPDARRRLRPRRQRQVTLEHRPVFGADDGVEVVPRPEAVEARRARHECPRRGKPASRCTGSSTARRSGCRVLIGLSFIGRAYPSKGTTRREEDPAGRRSARSDLARLHLVTSGAASAVADCAQDVPDGARALQVGASGGYPPSHAVATRTVRAPGAPSRCTSIGLPGCC